MEKIIPTPSQVWIWYPDKLGCSTSCRGGETNLDFSRTYFFIYIPDPPPTICQLQWKKPIGYASSDTILASIAIGYVSSNIIRGYTAVGYPSSDIYVTYTTIGYTTSDVILTYTAIGYGGSDIILAYTVW